MMAARFTLGFAALGHCRVNNNEDGKEADIDANGISNIYASDKSIGKHNQTTIVIEKGHMSLAKIDHLIREAEKFRGVGENAAVYDLEIYCFMLLNTRNKETLLELSKTGDKDINILAL
ncbi:unnamed protein product [Polarella glacialis]|uniref:Uncharacterized protein n=1 Tax=Polarella glacialis TaxID=89957 RepID=A0A813HWL0_POLGL|nr:unnamed protein product [Polarella glacialis]